jgi:hypothetical protein
MQHIHDTGFCYWCTDYMLPGTICDRPEVMKTSEITRRMQGLYDKVHVLESTITSMTTVIAMKDVHIRAQQDEINRLHRIVSSN